MYLSQAQLGEGSLFRTTANAHTPSRARLAACLNDPDMGTVANVCDALGISQPRLARWCKAQFGETPKKLLRRARMARMLARLAEQPYAEWRNFLDDHYFDQSHFIRDFKQFMGMCPTRYLALPLDVQTASAMRFSLGLGPRVTG